MAYNTAVFKLLYIATVLVTLTTCNEVFDLTHQLIRTMSSDETFKIYPYGTVPTFNQSGLRLDPSNHRYQSFCSRESAGTHLDAPFRANEHQWKVNQIPPDRLVAPLVVIRSKEGVRVKEIENWERAHGIIPEKSVVILNSGWSAHWETPKYRGLDVNTKKYKIPGFMSEACQFLATRKVVGVGVDTLQIDGDLYYDGHFECVNYLSDLDIYILKNVKIPEKLPESGATIFVGALNMREAAGSPVRLLASVFPNNSNMIHSHWFLIILCTIFATILHSKM